MMRQDKFKKGMFIPLGILFLSLFLSTIEVSANLIEDEEEFYSTIPNEKELETCLIGELEYKLNFQDLTASVSSARYEIESIESPKHIEIPATITFNGQSFEVTSIQCEAFASNNVLLTVKLPDTLKEIRSSAFIHCKNLKEVNLPEGLLMIGEQAFENCGLRQVKIPSTIQKIGKEAFRANFKLKTVSLPDNLKIIPDGMFFYCRDLENINFPSGLEIIEAYAFLETGLINVSLPASLKQLGKSAFSGCFDLESINIPRGITEINSYTFKACKNLEALTIPKTVKMIGFGAFEDCMCLILRVPKTTKLDRNPFNGVKRVVYY